jgi:hypothetical protein
MTQPDEDLILVENDVEPDDPAGALPFEADEFDALEQSQALPESDDEYR